MAELKFVRTEQPETAAAYLAGWLSGALAAGRPVLWLLSGGSGIATEVAAHKLVRPELRRHLVMVQVDERYGPIGHPDSNWQQLREAGLRLTDAETALPILAGKDLDQTVQDYTVALGRQLEQADLTIGFFGVGADGHTAGILPHSSALESQDLVAAYQGPDFERITITAHVIEQLDEAIVYATGEAKRSQLEALQRDRPTADQPAQLLKRAKAVTIFNDSIGENL